MTSTLMGVSHAQEGGDDERALEVVLDAKQRAALDVVSRPGTPKMLYGLFGSAMRQRVVFGGHAVEAWRARHGHRVTRAMR